LSYNLSIKTLEAIGPVFQLKIILGFGALCLLGV
jgi:hypothetical protein